MSQENISSDNAEPRDTFDGSDGFQHPRRLSVNLEIGDKNTKAHEKRRRSISVLLLGKKQNKVSLVSLLKHSVEIKLRGFTKTDAFIG